MSFSNELAARLIKNDKFYHLYSALQREAAAATLADQVEAADDPMEAEKVLDLLYCANIFAQTDNEQYKALAQSIALNSLLVDRNDVPVDRSLRLLADLGNFPALSYAEARHPNSKKSFADGLRTSIARELNAIQIGDQLIALTDFQKRTWDSFAKTEALAISAPTSAGKSFLVIEYLCRVATEEENFSAVYIAPTRALLSEVYSSVKTRMEGITNIRISTVPTPDISQGSRQVFILTQERLQVLLAVSAIKFDMIVVDEVQNLSDGARGMILQECLEQALDRNAATRLIMLAPGVEGFSSVQSAIGLKRLEPAISFLPSVIQNRILVSKTPHQDALHLSLISEQGVEPIGALKSKRGFDLPASRLAAVALELGQKGGSLVYATGPSDAEKVALQISRGSSILAENSLEILAEFIERHIHPKYGLAALVRKGVAFHYGKMPTLLREAIEAAFKSGALRF